MSRFFALSLGALWLCAIAFGLCQLWRHDTTPGRMAAAPSEWPAASALARVPDRATLVLFAHPRCPCTRAGLSELARLMARCPDRATVYVLFYKPGNRPADWEKTDSYYRAAAIPGVHALCDPDGIEARRFHAFTSGQALLYDANGRLAFNGGITATRGHEGDNAGLSALIALLTGQTPERTRTPVFGCALFETISK